jgi:heterodisulfide reductase subunit A-like polyferredoxin
MSVLYIFTMLFFLLGLSGLLSLSNAAVVTTAPPQTDYDAIVVGGGPAGLSALSGLARVRRNVLLVDSGEYRNGPTTHMHDVIGWDGTQSNPSTQSCSGTDLAK